MEDKSYIYETHKDLFQKWEEKKEKNKGHNPISSAFTFLLEKEEEILRYVFRNQSSSIFGMKDRSFAVNLRHGPHK